MCRQKCEYSRCGLAGHLLLVGRSSPCVGIGREVPVNDCNRIAVSHFSQSTKRGGERVQVFEHFVNSSSSRRQVTAVTIWNNIRSHQSWLEQTPEEINRVYTR